MFDSARRHCKISSAYLWPCAALLAAALGCGGADSSADRARLVVYSPHGPEILSEMETRFEAAYPDIDMKHQYLSPPDILAKLRAEQKNPYCDVWWGGTTQDFDRGANEGLLRPYSPSWAGAVGEDFRHPENKWFGQFIQVPCIVFNTKVMSADEAPKDWDELLDEKWTGRIVIREPLKSGTMKTIYTSVIQRHIDQGQTVEDGFDWLRRLEAQTAIYSPTPEAMFDKIGKSAEGYISLWNVTDALFQHHRNNYPFGFVVPRGKVAVSIDALAIAASSPNAEAAEAFYEFCTNIDSSAWLAEEHFRFVARDDLPESAVPEWRRGIEFDPMKIDWTQFNQNVSEWMPRWEKEIRDPKK